MLHQLNAECSSVHATLLGHEQHATHATMHLQEDVAMWWKAYKVDNPKVKGRWCEKSWLKIFIMRAQEKNTHWQKK